ncbi:PREDICTED: uncharacterized protein LOC104393351 [Chaetura pelagica]|uniref:uncharacterized protein LOC104393351 n=1 Tax=Chaetura pelagica TaxID=8897 RepID=UPI00052383BD|nr:PREDICTED: uncharacterized protein LOC104393351 [Chaetura pelagica]
MVAIGGEEAWDFLWDRFREAAVVSEADKLRTALSCSPQPWILNRYLQYTLDPTKIRKQDATSTINSIAGNVVGQPLAWDFIRSNWKTIFNQYGGGSFSFSRLILSVTERFSTEFELQQLKQFKEDNQDTGFGSGAPPPAPRDASPAGTVGWGSPLTVGTPLDLQGASDMETVAWGSSPYGPSAGTSPEVFGVPGTSPELHGVADMGSGAWGSPPYIPSTGTPSELHGAVPPNVPSWPSPPHHAGAGSPQDVPGDPLLDAGLMLPEFMDAGSVSQDLLSLLEALLPPPPRD